MGTDDEGGSTSTRRVFSRGEKEGKIAIDSGGKEKENCRDRGERGARIPRLYKNTKTFYKPAELPMHRSPGTREKKDGECGKRERTIAENECMGG